MPLSSLNEFIALISPIVPHEIRSSASAAPLYFFTMWATRRRLCFIRISLAFMSPLWNALIYVSSSAFESGFGNDDFSDTMPEKKRTFDKKVIKDSKIISIYMLNFVER